MGEANAHMTLRFESPQAALEAESKVKEVIKGLNDLYETWQTERFGAPGVFLESIRTRSQFGTLLTDMGLQEKVEADPHNGLAYSISMPGQEWTEYARNGSRIVWGGQVSHMLNWDFNVKAFEKAGIDAKITWQALEPY